MTLLALLRTGSAEAGRPGSRRGCSGRAGGPRSSFDPFLQRYSFPAVIRVGLLVVSVAGFAGAAGAERCPDRPESRPGGIASDDSVVVAGFAMSDYLVAHVETLLLLNRFTLSVDTNLGYFIRVPRSQARRATELLRRDAAARGYGRSRWYGGAQRTRSGPWREVAFLVPFDTALWDAPQVDGLDLQRLLSSSGLQVGRYSYLVKVRYCRRVYLRPEWEFEPLRVRGRFVVGYDVQVLVAEGPGKTARTTRLGMIVRDDGTPVRAPWLDE